MRKKIAILLFVLRNPLTFKERIFNLCAILFYGVDKKFINMLWLWWLKTGENNKLKLTTLNIFENKVNKRKKTQLKRLWDREKTTKRTQHATENRIRLKTYYFWDQPFINCERFEGL